MTPHEMTERNLALMVSQRVQDTTTAVQTDTASLFLPSFAQERLWFIDQLDPESALYNAYLAMRMQGNLNIDALRQSLQGIVDRHEILRTSFVPVNGRPRQAIAPVLSIPWSEMDLSDLADAERLEELNRHITASNARPFDLRHGPLIRATLYKLAPTDHILVVNLHHSVSDRWSAGIFWREISAFYHAALTGQPVALPALPLQYADYAAWQQQRLQGRFLDKQLTYWRQQLAGAPPVLELPTDFPRPAHLTSHGAQYSIVLPAELSAALRTLAQREGVTLFMVLLAAFQTLLLRYSGQDDIVVGTPVAGRTRVELEALIGLFLNTLALRTDLSGDPSFSELLKRERQVCLGAFEHQDLPFEKLIEDVNPERNPSFSPLFQTYFVLQNTPHERLSLDGLELQAVDLEGSDTKFDLVLGLLDGNSSLSGDIEYNTDLFTEATIAQMMRHFATLLAGIVADPSQRLSRLPLLSAAEAAQLLDLWRPPFAPPPDATSFAHLFERQVARTPVAEALIWRDERLTYAELDRRANQMAHYLQRIGIAPEMRVGVCMERTPELLALLLGILKVGGVYLPIDPTCPPERLSYMLNDAAVPIVLTQDKLHAQFAESSARIICIETVRDAIAQESAALVERESHPDMAAYVIYTSGSTGQPKGVIVPHRALMDRIPGIQARYKLGPQDRILQFVAMSFDVSLEEIFTPWLSGATVVLLPEEGVPSLQDVTRLVTEHQLTALDLPPSYWHEWVAELVHTKTQPPPSLRLMILGSEAASPATLAIWEQMTRGRVEWCNVYGLTETTLIAMTYGPENTAGWERYTSIPIGRPLANSQVYVLDAHLQPAPINVPGELYIGGPSLARGYLGRPDLTAERFVPNPFPGQGPGERLYRTGDRVRTLPDGNLEFLGRVDSQVNIRGYRVELSEIETLLRQYPGVREAVVLPLAERGATHIGNQATRLVGYVVTARPSTGLPTRLQHYLTAHLPSYMVPATILALQAMPRTPGGKIDRKALAALDMAQDAPASSQANYQTPIEELLAGIWAAVLQKGPITRNDDFFKLGGHSLQATQIVARLRDEFGVEVPVRAMYDAPTIATQSALIETLRLGDDTTRLPAIQPAARAGSLPLSFAQQRLWFLDQMEPDSPIYNIPSAILLRGDLDVAALERSLNALVIRHEPLRTTFQIVDDQPVQYILPALQVALPVVQLADLPSDERTSATQGYLAREAQQSFDLTHGPLIRATLLRQGETEHTLLLTLHHSAADGWSLDIMLRELSVLYAAYHSGQEPALPALPVQYADYAVWQRDWMQGPALTEQLTYWQTQLAGVPPVLELPTDFPRPAQVSYQGAHVTFSLPSELSAALRALAQREGVTLFMLMLATFQTFLGRYSGQEDIVVGTPVAGRRQRETEGLIGLFVNTLPVRTSVRGNPAFRDLLKRVRETCLGAYEHQDLPFEKLVDVLHLDRTLSYAPLFQVVFALQHAAQGQMEWPGLTLEALDPDSGTAKFDLALTMSDSGDLLEGWLEFSTDLFQQATINRLVRHWENLLAGIVADPDQRLTALPLLDAAERRQLLEEWTATQRPYPHDASIPAIFAAQAAQTPDAVALIFGDARLSYAALNHRANQIAHCLRECGVGPEVAVGVCLERSFDLIASLLGILKAGGFYVPLDPAYPQERLTFMLADARVSVLVTQSSLLAQLPTTAVTVVCLDRDHERIARQPVSDLPVCVGPHHLAYVNYTSGSTGMPKGVSIPQQAVLRLVKGNSFAHIDANEVFLQLAPVSFDAATLEIWGPLLNGGQLVIMPPAAPALEDVAEALVRHHVTILWLTAGLFHLMTDEQLASLRGVRQLLAGGDVLSVPHVRQTLAHHPGNTLINGYGPTENTTFTCCYPMTDPAHIGTTVSIGKPIANTHVYVLDAQMQPVPVGVAGELYIGGAGLARGYVNRPDLTADRFVPHPFSRAPGARLYRSGDRVRYLPDGNVEFLGRLDNQVKIHGFRIELGEIETVLAQHPAVGDCVVVANKDGMSARLVAYVTPAASSATNELRAYLRERLPEYMVPAAFIELAVLPLTANGKVDRDALPAPASVPTADSTAFHAPSTATETILADIWAQVLRLERVGVDNNFFELGGDSILSMQVIARARQAGVHLTPKQLFQFQTIAELAAVATFAPAVVAEQGAVSGPVPLTPIQHWFFAQQLTNPQHYNQAMLLEGPADLDGAMVNQVITQLVLHHDALRLRFSRVVDGWRQQILAPDATLPKYVQVVDISALPADEQRVAIEARTADLQGSLHVGYGPLLRVVVFHLGAHVPSRLLFIIHHLAVDAISWRVLLDDFAAAYRQLGQHIPMQLPAKTTSFKQWSEGLQAYAQSSALAKEAAFWQTQMPQASAPLPVDHQASPAVNTEDAARSVVVTLSAAETRDLLQEVPKAYHTQINDALLTAVAAAFSEWTGSPRLLIDLEGHGREPIIENIDLSRTVGWFTAIYPVVLDITGKTTPGTMLPAIKEQLRQIPQRGVSYGIARFLNLTSEIGAQLAHQPPAEVAFNYLGQFTADTAATDLFIPAREAVGPEISPRNRREHLFEVLGSVTNGQLRFMWVYCPHFHNQATVEGLAQRFSAALRAIIAHCLAPEAGGSTPSDFPLAQLNTRSLNKLAALLNEGDDE